MVAPAFCAVEENFHISMFLLKYDFYSSGAADFFVCNLYFCNCVPTPTDRHVAVAMTKVLRNYCYDQEDFENVCYDQDDLKNDCSDQDE